MFSLTLDDLAQATGAHLACGNPDVAPHGLVRIDSREVQAGDIFVAFKGEHLDANDFCTQVVEKGAALVVLTRSATSDELRVAQAQGAALMEAGDATQWLLDTAHLMRTRHPEWMVVAITGSVGKTTTKELTAGVLAQSCKVHATKLNFNNLIGMPMTLLNTKEGTQALVLEMGMNHFHEIERMSRCAEPNLAVITNIGTAHIGILGSRENIARAKSEMVLGMRAYEADDAHTLAPTLFIDSSCDFADFIEQDFCASHGVDLVRLSASGLEDELTWSAVEKNDEAMNVCMRIQDLSTQEHIDAQLHIPGTAAYIDARFAVALAHTLGMSLAEIQAGLESVKPVDKRMQIAKTQRGAQVIDDTYNASPNSMAAAIDALFTLKGARHIVVLGEMGELGEQEVMLHQLVGAYVAGKRPDQFVTIGQNLAAEMIQGAATMGYSNDCMNRFETVDEALAALGDAFGEGDCLLVKASRSCGLERFVKGLLA